MSVQQEKILYGDAAMQSAGSELATALQNDKQFEASIITLSGELGAGKTTFCRGFIHACGYKGAVKSPTYTLIERYDTAFGEICHLDLYRLEEPDELEFIGFRDLLESGAALLIEWPERVPSMQNITTLAITIEHRDQESRRLEISPR